ncbi:hypothetical protein ACFL5F_00325 [Planctomycetota bacterium]
MFDLNQEITKWRNNLAQSETLGESDVDELEGHLQEEFESLKGSKLSDEEAFLVAAHRLGDMARLSDEYAKIYRGKRFRQNVSWMITGILIYLLATHFDAAVSKGCVLLAANSGITGYRSLGFIGFGSKILTLITTFILGYFFCRLILQTHGFEKQIKQLITRMCFLMKLLVFLLMTVVFRIAFSIPVPGFRSMNIQQDVVQASTYTKHLWSAFLPVILVMVLINLSKPNLHEVE